MAHAHDRSVMVGGSGKPHTRPIAVLPVALVSGGRSVIDLGSIPAPSAPRGGPSETLLVFSDVHLGSDLSDLPAGVPARSPHVDRDLVSLLAHYRKAPPQADRWRIVIAGDFIDFIGMTIRVGSERSVATELNAEELEHGLGNAEDHAREKLSRVATRHGDVFAELASFVADGHALTLVLGNHDLEFHWRAVQEDFCAVLLSLAGTDVDSEAFLARIEFSPWFFYRDGVAYIEHGHQYDPFCSTEHIMAPLSPADPRRVARGFCDVLLRFVVRPTTGLKEHGHETLGLVDYVSFGLKLGLGGMKDVFVRFVRAVFELFRLRRGHVSETARLLREEHERRVAKLGLAIGIGREKLSALLKLQAPPLTQSIRGILASLLLDRIALGMLAILCLAAVAIVGAFVGHAFFGVIGVLIAWSLLHRHLSRQRTVDASEQLAERAGHLARLFPAAFVVMGHTHTPTTVPAGDATYINVGSWAEEDGAVGADRAARTHLVIRGGESPQALFCRWDPEKGPLSFSAHPSV